MTGGSNFDRARTACGKLRALALGSVAAAALATSPALADINTLPDWDGAQFISSWGVPNTQTYGQTITATLTNSVLSSMTFQLNNQSGGPAQYQAFVYAWDATNSRITGPALFASGLLTAPSGATFQPVTISTGKVTLTPGQQYVLFLSTSNGTQVNSAYRWGSVNNSLVPGGQFVFQNNGTNFNNLSTASWSTVAIDLAMNLVMSGGNFGEAPVGFQQSSVQLMNDFLSLMLDPFAETRGGFGMQGGALGYAAPSRQASTDASAAYAQVFKGPRAVPDPNRWSIWAGGYGGYNKTDGDANAGTHDTTARTYGYAVGADYRLAGGTTLGFAVSGGHTSWGLSEAFGGGKSDAFQVGGYATQSIGQLYVAAAVAAAFHDVSSDRTVVDETLKGNFHGYNLAGRIESGYRYGTPFGGLTPYAAAQIQSLYVSGFTETSSLAAPIAAQTFSDRSANAIRTELGVRADKRFAFGDSTVTLFGRAAWAHDFNRNPNLTAVFLTLPGTTFTVFGAKPTEDLALASVGAELVMINGWSAMAKFSGEFGDGTQTYGGSGKLRYRW
jgi:autotransporter-like protein